VRELENRLRRATLVAEKEIIEVDDLDLAGHAAERARSSASTSASTAPGARSDDAERATLEGALQRAGANVSKAAAELGLSRQAFYRRLERAGLTIERRTKPT
jgi:DNA-binding NtrC family response regulator